MKKKYYHCVINIANTVINDFKKMKKDSSKWAILVIFGGFNEKR